LVFLIIKKNTRTFQKTIKNNNKINKREKRAKKNNKRERIDTFFMKKQKIK
jgi:hypothetical protein